jgi:hypothetical protein
MLARIRAGDPLGAVRELRATQGRPDEAWGRLTLLELLGPLAEGLVTVDGTRIEVAIVAARRALLAGRPDLRRAARKLLDIDEYGFLPGGLPRHQWPAPPVIAAVRRALADDWPMALDLDLSWLETVQDWAEDRDEESVWDHAVGCLEEFLLGEEPEIEVPAYMLNHENARVAAVARDALRCAPPMEAMK